MKTNLNRIIDSKEDAEQWLTDLFNNGELWHPDDEAFDIDWPTMPTVTELQMAHVLMTQVCIHHEAPCKFILDNLVNTAEHLDYKEPEREQEDPERKVWSAMQGGTDGG